MGSHHYRVGQCAECSLLYRVPAIRPERVKDLYSTGTYADFLDGDYGDNREDMYSQLLDQFAPEFDAGNGRTVLDFGCGTGRFMDVAHDRGFEVYGVDLAQDALDRAAQRHDPARLALDPALITDLPADGLDLITMWSVMAHIAEPIELLTRLRAILKPGGQLLLYTVNAPSLQRRGFGSHWNGFTHNHLIFWDKANLDRLFRKTGFATAEFRHGYFIDADSTDFPRRLVRRHYRSIEKYDGANMLLAVARA